MGDFSNKFNDASHNANDYIQRLLALVEGRDPLQILGELPSKVEDITRGVDDATIRRPEAEDKWSMVEVVQHLADAEVINAVRYRMILGHDTPPITGYDQDSLATNLKYREASLADALEVLRVMRRANLRLLSPLTPEEKQKAGMHSERGRETVERLMRLHAAHDVVHTRQLERVKRAVT